ncbi:uncharacterized protein LOC124203098 isoform X3 [Daphnia pulex]|uniref:uncharacterized protein LOC124203098 isoform X3 n=1 Tax=Daphnia pulex TaxID=6669 RepID=UPI001EDD26E9|nr:uncharacterized protein LOC124203098 isoform X3 [Daphnia pulex]
MGFIAPFIRPRVGRQSNMPKSELEQDDEEDCDKSDDESVKNVHENGNSEIQIDAEKEIETENNNSENTESVERKTGYDESSCSSESLRQTQKTRRILDSGTFYPSDNEDSNNSGNFNEYIDFDDGLDASGSQLYKDSPLSSSSIILENIEVKKATNNSASGTASSNKKSADASKDNPSNRKHGNVFRNVIYKQVSIKKQERKEHNARSRFQNCIFRRLNEISCGKQANSWEATGS